MKNLKINSANLMVQETSKDVTAGGGSSSWTLRSHSKPVVLKTPAEREAATNKEAGGQQTEQQPASAVKLIEAPKADFKKVHTGKMCTQYNQLSIASESPETCSEQVKEQDACISGQGYFFWGEVTVSHKECACCLGVNEDEISEG